MNPPQNNCTPTQGDTLRVPPQAIHSPVILSEAAPFIGSALEAHRRLQAEPNRTECARLLRKTFAQTLSLLLVEFATELSVSADHQPAAPAWIGVSFPAHAEADSVTIAFHALDRSARAVVAHRLGRPDLAAEYAPW
jgi:hypothetical protein